MEWENIVVRYTHDKGFNILYNTCVLCMDVYHKTQQKSEK